MIELWHGRRATASCSCRRSSTCQDPDAVLARIRELIGPGGVAYVSTPNVLTLAGEGGRSPATRGTCSEYRHEEFRALCERHFGSVEVLGLFHARKLRWHQLAIEQARWDERPPGAADHQARSTTASRPRSPCATSRCDATGLDRALDFVAVLRPVRRAGALSLVLHTHMPYVEGFGTWPFGEEWLWEAIATSLPAAPRRARRGAGPRHALRHAGARRPARGAGRARALRGVPARDPPASRTALDVEAARGGGRARGRRGARAVGARVRRRRRARGAAVARAAARRTRPGPRRRPTPCCRCWPPSARHAHCSSAPASRRTAPARAAGTAASGCPSARTRRGWTRCSRRRACTRPASSSPTSSGRRRPAPAPAAHRRPGRCSCRSTARSIDLVWGVDGYPSRPRLPRLAPPDGAPPPRLGDRRRGLRPRARARRRPARTRPTSSRGSRRACAAAGCASARSTPSCSGTGGTRAPAWLAAVLERGRGGGPAGRRARRGARRARRRPPRPSCRHDAGARRATCRPGAAPARAGSPGASGAPSCALARELDAARARGARAAGRAGVATGRSCSPARARRRVPRRARRRPPARARGARSRGDAAPAAAQPRAVPRLRLTGRRVPRRPTLLAPSIRIPRRVPAVQHGGERGTHGGPESVPGANRRHHGGVAQVLCASPSANPVGAETRSQSAHDRCPR